MRRLHGSKLLIGNVGDSRCYLFQNGACMQVTLDHSYVNELVRAGTIKIEDIPNLDLDQFASVITRAIGAAREVEPDFFFIDLHPGDAVLLASDGLTRYVEGNSIAELVDPSNLQGSCQKLIDKAKAAGGADNITCILLRYDAPVTTQPEAQVETPLDAKAPAPTETQPEVPVEVPAGPPIETAMDTSAEAEAQAEKPAAELDAPAESPVDAAAVVATDAPTETGMEAATETETETPAETDAQAETNVQAETKPDAPADVPSPVPTPISFEALLEAAEAQPASSSGDPLEALFEAEPEAKPTTPEAPSLPVSHEQQV